METEKKIFHLVDLAYTMISVWTYQKLNNFSSRRPMLAGIV
jgi:hypothetical protein